MSDHNSRNNGRGDAVSRFVRTIRDHDRMPVSYIQADDRIERIHPMGGDQLAAVLDALVRQAPVYRWSEIAGHYVLYPRAAVWNTRIAGVQITNVPRLEAATRFVDQIRSQVPGLGDLAEPPLIGDPRSPVFTQPVSLPADGSILEGLVALLGPDPRMVFTIERSRFGERVLYFERVPE